MEKKLEKEEMEKILDDIPDSIYKSTKDVLSQPSKDGSARLKDIADEVFGKYHGKIPDEFGEESFILCESFFIRACSLGDYEFAEKLFDQIYPKREFEKEISPDIIMFDAMWLEGIDDLFVGGKDWVGVPPKDSARLPFSISRLYYHSIMDNPLLIIGETGTSKELLARVIHRVSRRWKETFCPINCAAISEDLFESEFFGHKKGAFTGAIADKKGFLEEADKGTAFLDEIGKMPPPQQAKLLRVIEERKITRVGDTKQIPIDVRFIAAAQPKDIKDIIEEGIIPDLLNRLGFPNCIELPTLNERLRVVPARVIENSLKRALGGIPPNVRGPGLMPLTLNDNSRKVLLKREYRGHYRELENILKGGIISAMAKERTEILPEDFEEPIKVAERFYGTLNTGSLFNEATLEDVPLKDCVEYADKVKASIVETKVKDVLRSGKKIKTVLEEEKATETYQNFRKKVKTITGKDIRELRGL